MREAIRLDPQFGQPYADIADALSLNGQCGESAAEIHKDPRLIKLMDELDFPAPD